MFTKVMEAPINMADKYLTATKDNHAVTRFAKGVATGALTIAYAVAALFVNLVALAAKGIQFFIPKRHSEGFDNKILSNLAAAAHATSQYTAKSAAKTVANIMFKGNEAGTVSDYETAVFNFYTSDKMMSFLNYHICNDEATPAPTAPAAPAPAEAGVGPASAAAPAASPGLVHAAAV